jgi:hypothetical protein
MSEGVRDVVVTRVLFVGASGLLGDVLASQLRRHGELISIASIPDLDALPEPSSTDVLVVEGSADALQWIRTALELRVHARALVIVVDRDDPYSYLFHLHVPGLACRRLRLAELVEMISCRQPGGGDHPHG